VLVGSPSELTTELKGSLGLEALLAPRHTLIGPDWMAFGASRLVTKAHEIIGGQWFSPAMTQGADACGASDLRISLGPIQRISAGAASSGAIIEITNISRHRCTLIGSPAAQLQASAGRRILQASTATGLASQFDIAPVASVGIAPGRSAWSTIAWWNGNSARSATVEIVLPNGSRTVTSMRVSVDPAQEMSTTPVRGTRPSFS